MQEDLTHLLESPELVEKILIAYEKYGKMSATYLAHKFKLNAHTAYAIMKVITLSQKEFD